jgi:hypothetical protein
MTQQPNIRPRQDHVEAVRLSWKACHVPIGTILISGLALASVMSAVFTMLADGPIRAVP